ncbi:MAG: hypothetical protein EXS25_10965 [Pedosphaera sp.]|nr:hypothetical protein [Pedosphaera sp.]
MPSINYCSDSVPKSDFDFGRLIEERLGLVFLLSKIELVEANLYQATSIRSGSGFSHSKCFCVFWVFQTREANRLGAISNSQVMEMGQMRQGFMALLQDSAQYSEKNLAMRSLLERMGFRINSAATAQKTTPSTPPPSNPVRR